MYFYLVSQRLLEETEWMYFKEAITFEIFRTNTILKDKRPNLCTGNLLVHFPKLSHYLFEDHIFFHKLFAIYY